MMMMMMMMMMKISPYRPYFAKKPAGRSVW